MTDKDDLHGNDVNDDGLIELTDIIEEKKDHDPEEDVIDLTDVIENQNDNVIDLLDVVKGDVELEVIEEKDPADGKTQVEIIPDEIVFKSSPKIKLQPLDKLIDNSKLFTDETAKESDDKAEEHVTGPEEFEDETGVSFELPDLHDQDYLEKTEKIQDDGTAEDITEEQFESALERVIEKKFSEKIETILFEVMERVIKKEILEIKQSLQKDLDDIGNV